MTAPIPHFALDAATLARHVDAAAHARGLAVFSRRQVVESWLHYDAAAAPGHRWQVRGAVRGSRPEPYQASATVTLGPQGRVLRFSSACTCAAAVDCKHTVALVLQAARTGPAPNSRQGEPAAAAPAPLSLPAPVRAADHAVQQWLARFDAPVPPATEQTVFLLHADGPTPCLSWGTARRLQRGEGWTQIKTPYGLPPAPGGVPDAAQECVQLIGALGSAAYGRGLTSHQAPVHGHMGLLALRLAAQTGRLFLAGAPGRIEGEPLRWGEGRVLQWRWTDAAPLGDAGAEPRWQLSARVMEAADGGEGASAAAVLPGPPPWYLDPAARRCGPAVAPGMADDQLALLLAAPPIAQSTFDQAPAALLTRLAGLPLPPTVAPVALREGITPTACLHIGPVPRALQAALGLLCATLTFDYGGLRGYWPSEDACVLLGDTGHRAALQRDLPAERAAQAALGRRGLRDDGTGRHHLPPADAGAASTWRDWAVEDFADLRHAGFCVTLDDAMHGFIQHAGALEMRLTDAHGGLVQRPAGVAAGAAMAGGPASAWFGLSLGIEIGGVRENVLPWLPGLLAQLQATPEGAALPEWVWRQREDGGFVRLPSAPLRPWLQALLELVDERPPEGDVLRLSRLEAIRLGAALADDAASEGTQWADAAPLAHLLGALTGREALPEAPLPQGLTATLRPYQREGLNWLQLLRAQGLGGILADEMGLGKTLQLLAHILVEKQALRLDRPALVVAPVSLLGNWQREAARFAPALRTRVWHGAGRKSSAAPLQEADLVIAPYSLLQRDRAVWLGHAWHLAVLDEAQHIKNASTQAAQVAAGLDARHRLCLSGTPLENHLGELWSLFHFLMPGLLGSRAAFDRRFRTPIEQHGDPARLHQLRRRVAPFLLRRTKADVAGDLPPKVENVVTVALAGPQADLYETVRLATEKTVRAALTEHGLARSQIQVLDALLQLRQVCCDPRLLAGRLPSAPSSASAKFDWLMERLPALLAQGRRVLVFSQFTSMLALIEAGLKERGLAWTKLTGQTRQRDRAIARFTEGEVPLMLISLKAGGTGLNLPQADTVIHYDPWWNPAAQAQATGRAHRIGQERTVFVYQLVAEGTLEQRILALQARKAGLAERLYGGAAGGPEAFSTEGLTEGLTESAVAELLRPLD